MKLQRLLLLQAAILLGLPSVSLLAPPAHAVELKGQIRGVVTDADGLAIPGAVIAVSSPQLQGTVGDTTDEEGRFRAVGLPAGEYKVEVTKPGFQTWRGVSMRVNPGGTLTLTVTLQSAVAGEEIVVEETKPTVDVTAVSSGVNLTKEMLRDIPSAGRDYQSALGLASGVVGGGNPYMHGGFDSSNQYYLDGVNTTDPLTNTFSMNMNFDAIEEIQVITGGLDAEYGRSMGGTVNIVTKSGGNEFEGSAQYLYSSQATQLYQPLEGEDKDSLQFSDQSLALNLGGPLIRDKLWFFASVQGNYYLSTESVPEDVGRPEEYPMAPRDWKSGYLFGKLTWKPNANNQLWIHGQTDPTIILNEVQSPYVLPSNEVWRYQGGWLASLGHQWTPSGDVVVDTQAYFQRSSLHIMPITWRGCENWSEDGFTCLDEYDPNEWEGIEGSWSAYDPDGFSVGPYWYSYYTMRQRASLTSSLKYFFDFLGEHQVKLGVQGEALASDSFYTGLTEGITLYKYTESPTDWDSYEPYMLQTYNSNYNKKLTGYLGTVFLQDVWKPVPRLTVRPGVRMDASSLLNDFDEQVFSSVTVAPRLGFAYDVLGDHRWNVHVYYGRVYDSGYLGVSNALSKIDTGLAVYQWDPEANEGAGGWGEEPIYSTSPNNLVAPDLKNPYSDEIDAGIDRDLGNGWGLGAGFAYEKAHNFWEDDEVNVIWNAEGSDAIGFRNGENVLVYRFRTPDDIWTRYMALDLSVSKQFSDKWGMLGSYTWSNAYGTQSDQMVTAYYDVPEQRQYEEGILAYDIPHSVKLQGSYRDDHKWSLGDKWGFGYLFGWDFRIRSGYPYRKSYYNDYFQGWSNVYDDATDPDRLPAISSTNLKGGLTVAVGRGKFDLTAECFNVFNSREVTSVDTTYTDENGDVYTDSNGDVLYGTPLARQDPRYFQFGIRGEF